MIATTTLGQIVRDPEAYFKKYSLWLLKCILEGETWDLILFSLFPHPSMCKFSTVPEIVIYSAMKGRVQHFKELAYFGQTIRRALATRLIMDHCLQLQGECSYSIIKKWWTALPGRLQENLTTCEHMGEYLSIHGYHHHINTNQDYTCYFSLKANKQRCPIHYLQKRKEKGPVSCCVVASYRQPPPIWQPGFVMQDSVSACHVLCLETNRGKENQDL